MILLHGLIAKALILGEAKHAQAIREFERGTEIPARYARIYPVGRVEQYGRYAQMTYGFDAGQQAPVTADCGLN